MRRFGLVLLVVGACGTGDVPADPDAGIDAPLPDGLAVKIFFPLAVGASWTYQVTDPQFPGAPATTKVQSVEAFEDVGGEKAGVMAFRLKTVKPGDEVITWQETTSTGLVTITPARGEDEPDDEDRCPGYSDKATIVGGFAVEIGGGTDA